MPDKYTLVATTGDLMARVRLVDLGDDTFGFVMAGNVASGAAAAGNPVPSGGDYRATPITLADGQRGTVQLDFAGSVKSRAYGTISAGADGFLNASLTAFSGANEANSSRLLQIANYGLNGSGSWDRVRADTVAQSVLPGLSATFWNYAAAAGGIVNTTTAVTVKAAAGAGVRNYVTAIDLSWDSLTTATEFAIRDGASGTVLWRHKIPSGGAGRFNQQFSVPLRGTANTLVEVVTLTAAGAAVGVFANLQGFTGA